MEVSALQTKEYKQRPASYLSAGAIGALSGYSLKYILPIRKQERDDRFRFLIVDMQNKARVDRLAEIEAIRKAEKQAPSADVFLKMVDDNQLKESTIKNLDVDVQKQVMLLLAQVNDKARAAREVGRLMVNATIKDIRPTGAFVAAGAGVAIIGALVHNIIQRVSKNQNS